MTTREAILEDGLRDLLIGATIMIESCALLDPHRRSAFARYAEEVKRVCEETLNEAAAAEVAL